MRAHIPTVYDLQARVHRAATFAQSEGSDGSIIVTLFMPQSKSGDIEMVAAPVTADEAAQLQARFKQSRQA